MTNPNTPTPPAQPGSGMPSLPDLAEAAAARWVQRKLAEQPWYRRKSNTITALGGVLATILGFVVTNAAGMPEWVVYAASAGILVLTVLGVNVTPNGTTASTARDLQEAVRDPLVLNTVAAQIEQTMGADLEERVRAAVQRSFGAGGVDEAAARWAGRHRRAD